VDATVEAFQAGLFIRLRGSCGWPERRGFTILQAKGWNPGFKNGPYVSVGSCARDSESFSF
jgi:hypothetical protein